MNISILEMLRLLPLALLLTLSACTTVSTLRSSTISQGSTATEIIYEMVLGNLAMIHKNNDALPWHLKITQGGIGVTDSASPTFSITWPTLSRTSGISATRQWAVSWTVVPVLDKQTLLDLRGRYRSELEHYDIYYEEGFAPPPDVPSGKFGGKYIWVRQGHMNQFVTLVTDILDKTPVSAAERGIQLPGPQVPR